MDYDYDMLDNELSLDQDVYYDEEQSPPMTLEQVISYCMQPVFFQTLRAIAFIVLWNFVFRICIHLIDLSQFFKHAISVITGLLSLYGMFPVNFPILLILPLISYPVLLILKSYRGVALLCLSSIVLITYELIWLNAKVWHQIRGPQMIFVMKIVSLGFDLDIGTVKDVPGSMEFSSYMLFPGNVIFGPWISLNDHQKIFRPPKWKWKFIGNFLIRLLYAFIALFISSCWVHFILPDGLWKWILAYRDALSFRTSHYFISFMSEAMLILSGVSSFGQNDDIVVTKPFDIELPRSLIQVVISWNIPMHNWLKIYVFNTTRSLGSFLAILSTYAVSALLHGLNFQLGAVLLSLGFYSYVEFMLRKKLALIFSACIQAKACKADCNHVNKSNSPYVIITNVFLSILAMIHLAYLGLMFDHDPASETGYSYLHTLNKWSHLDYFSHYLALLSYLIYFLI